MTSTPKVKQFIVINSQNSLVSVDDARLMINACNILAKQVVSAWEYNYVPRVILWSDMESAGIKADEDARRFLIVGDSSGISSAFSAHAEKNVNISSLVFTRNILTNGGVFLASTDDKPRPTIAAALFCAIAESIVNPAENQWWSDALNGELIASKICDPVESTSVIVNLKISPNPEPQIENKINTDDILDALFKTDDKPPESVNVSTPAVKEPVAVKEPIEVKVVLCNFVFPAWRDSSAKQGTQFDFMNTLKHPFQIAIGGSCLKLDSQSKKPIITFDRHVPVWKRELKQILSGII